MHLGRYIYECYPLFRQSMLKRL